jgi:hypothetical protein
MAHEHRAEDVGYPCADVYQRARHPCGARVGRRRSGGRAGPDDRDRGEPAARCPTKAAARRLTSASRRSACASSGRCSRAPCAARQLSAWRSARPALAIRRLRRQLCARAVSSPVKHGSDHPRATDARCFGDACQPDVRALTLVEPAGSARSISSVASRLLTARLALVPEIVCRSFVVSGVTVGPRSARTPSLGAAACGPVCQYAAGWLKMTTRLTIFPSRTLK